MWLPPLILLTLAVALGCAPTAHSFGIHIPPGGMEHCFFREVHANYHIYIHYVARETINIKLMDTNDKVLYAKRSVLQGSFDFQVIEDGSYRICLSVEQMRRKPTITKFRFLVVDPNISSDKIATLEQVHTATKLCDDVKKLSDRVLFRTHLYSDTALETDEVLKSSISLTGRLVALECVAALLAAVSQVSYVRKMLWSSRSRLQRMV
ncbi:unnamed protein product [Agarophyton chilense]